MSSPPPEDAPPQEKLRLKVVEGNAAGRVIVVEDEFVIGRQAEGDGTLASDVEISRRHARVFPESDGCFGIEDLGSTNGTFVNGRRLDASVILETGDRISVGASTLIVQVGSLQPTPRASDTMRPPPDVVEAPTEEQEPGNEAEPEVAEPVAEAAEPAVANFALRIEVDVAAGRATVALDDGADEVTLVQDDGRWRID